MPARHLLDSASTSYNAGRIAGRLIFLVLVPVFVIALIYWLTGRGGPRPLSFSHALSRWWVWVAGLLTGIVLLLTLSFSLASST